MHDKTWLEYRRELHRFIAGRVGDSALAEDLVHEVLLRAYTRREQLKDPAHLRGWLYRITRNLIVDHYRKHRDLDALPDDLLEESDDIAGDAEKQLANCLTPLIDKLPAIYGDALKLADLESVPQAEVAQRFDLSLSGAKSRIQRARILLKESLMNCCRIELDHKGHLLDTDAGCGENAPCGGGCSAP